MVYCFRWLFSPKSAVLAKMNFAGIFNRKIYCLQLSFLLKKRPHIVKLYWKSVEVKKKTVELTNFSGFLLST